MKRTTRNAAKTKQEIIEKSAPVFNVNGYAGTKMQMLIEATGYQMGGIYRHFGTKMDLAKAVFQYNYEIVVKANLTFDETLNPKEKLLMIASNYSKMVMTPKVKGGCPLMNTITEFDDPKKTDEDSRQMNQLAKTFTKEVIQILQNILEEGQSTGHFQPNIHPQKEAQYILASFQGAILLGQITKKGHVVLGVFDKIVDYLERCVFVS